jgi:L-fuculose-phosphate aldolase
MNARVTLPELERNVARVAARMYERGYVSGHWGNITALTSDGTILGTPNGVPLCDVTEKDLVLMDRTGGKIAGRGKPFWELPMHLAVYRARPDVGAIVHAHPVATTTFAAANKPIDGRFSAEFTFMTGGLIPVVPFAMPGSETLNNNLLEFVEKHDIVLLGSHGVMAWADSPVKAFALIDQVEEIARILINSASVGQIKPLSEEYFGLISDARLKAGFGPAGRDQKLRTR